MHHKQNNKEMKTYVQGLRPFGNILPRGVKGILRKNGYNYSEIISKWKLLVGKNIASCCFPKSIKMSQENKNGTLILAVERGDEINAEYSKKMITDKINSYFGYKLISEIKLQTFNSVNEKKNKNNLREFPKSFEREINQIKNENIKNSLTQLLKAMKNG